MRRTAMLGSAGTLIAGTLIAGAIAAPAAGADGRHYGDQEARGVQIAAARAAKAGIDWTDCPADWALAAPIQCGWVSVPLDYAKPNGKRIKLAVFVQSGFLVTMRLGNAIPEPPGPPGL